MDLLKWIDMALVVLLITVILGTFYSFRICNDMIRQIDETYGVEDDKRYEKEWEVASKWTPIGQYGQLLTFLTLLTLENWHPIFLAAVSIWQIKAIQNYLQRLCEDTVYRSEKLQYIEMRKKNEADAKDVGHHIAAKVWDDVSPIYNRAKWICIVIGTAFISLRIILNLIS